jgi:hypothetical protein
MGGLTFWLGSLILCGAIVCISWSLLRGRATDRPAIDVFAEKRGLRIISVKRSYNVWRYWLRGIGVANAVRFYVVAVEDSEGTRGDIHLAFDSLFGRGQVEVLEPQGLALTPPDGSVSLTLLDSSTARPSWSRRERLALFGMGVGFGGFVFGGILYVNLSSPNRPVLPETALGFTHLFRAKYGNVYGTYFEYLAVTYGIWAMWGFGAVSALFGYILDIQHKSRTYPRQICAAAAISMALCYAIWRMSICVGQS